MCLTIDRRDRKTRSLLVIGNVALVAGVLLWNFTRGGLVRSHPWFDGIIGLVYGVSFAANIAAILRRGRCRPAESILKPR